MLTINSNTKKLPDSFCKNADSNNNKLLTLDSELRAECNNDIVDVYNSLDLYQATGKTLDQYGDMVGQKRGGLNDEQYRLMILIRIARNNAGVDYNSILSIMSLVLKCEPSDICIENANESASIKITQLPFATINNAGFTTNQAIAMIESLLPITVTLDSASFEGTFEFASEETLETDNNKGFADDDITVGGYLGCLVETSNNGLPI